MDTVGISGYTDFTYSRSRTPSPRWITRSTDLAWSAMAEIILEVFPWESEKTSIFISDRSFADGFFKAYCQKTELLHILIRKGSTTESSFFEGELMNIDKRTLDGLLKLPDDKLMQMLCLVTGTSNGKSASPESIAGLRKALSQVTDADIARAVELISAYKLGKKG